MSSHVPAVREAAPGELEVLSQVLARAFEDDPVACYFFPAEEGRIERLEKFFLIEMRDLYSDSSLILTNSELSGASIWAPPGSEINPVRALFALLPMARLLGLRSFFALRALNYLNSLHPKTPKHYYLATVGVEPELQGRGIGSSLLEPVLKRADDEGVPAYLESSKERNVPFYERHGFRVQKEVRLPAGGPPVWLMWRDPQV